MNNLVSVETIITKDKLRALESAPIGIVITRGGKFLFVNTAFTTMYGYSASELLGKSVSTLQPKTLTRKRLRSILRERGIAQLDSYDSMGLRKDQSIFPIHIEANNVIYEDQPSTLAYITDISSVISMSQSQIQFEENVRQFLLTSPVAFVVTKDRRISDANDAFVAIFGYSSVDEIIGLDTKILQAEGSRQDISSKIDNREQGDYSIEVYETMGLKKDGTEFKIKVTATRTEFDDSLVIVVFIEKI